MTVTLITVTHSFVNPDQSAASGMVVFKLSERITNGTQSYAPTIPIHASLDVDGNLSQLVPANNDPTTFPAGSSYTVTLILNGLSGDTYTDITVPYNAPGATVDLGSLLPQQVGQ